MRLTHSDAGSIHVRFRLRRLPSLLAGLALAVLGHVPVLAATKTANLSVAATLQLGCSTVATPNDIDFGSIHNGTGTTAQDYLGQTDFSITCAQGSAYTINLGPGTHGLTSPAFVRQMSNGTSLVAYQLYQDLGYTQIWGDASQGASFASSQTGTGSAQTFTIYARIANGTAVPGVGVYSDTVQITVTY
jgi:spore coat protein U-like protein